MTTPDLRRAEPGDAHALARVHVTSWAETYQGLMPDGFLAAMTGEARRERRQIMWRQTLEADKESVLVAVQDGAVVGFVSGGPTDF